VSSTSKKQLEAEKLYQRFLNAQATKVIGSRWGLVLIAVLLALVAYDISNFKNDMDRILVGARFAPCIILILISLFKQDSVSPSWMENAPHWFDLICVSYVGASVLLTIICHKTEFPLDSAPIQISLFAACMLGFHSLRYIMIRNILFVFLVSVSIALFDSTSLLIAQAAQLIVGGGVGSVIFLLITNSLFQNQYIISTRLSQQTLDFQSHLESTKYDHQKTMIFDGFKEEETMPCHTGEALVFKLDVIDSSKIRDTNYPRHFEAFCEEAEAELLSHMTVASLDPVFLRGRGYFIKSVGDAAIFSIGNPVAVAKPYTMQDATDFLLKTIDAAFKKHMSRVSSENPILYCIGVAYDNLQGGFSGKRKFYDLNGRGQILAERYENLRKRFQSLSIPLPNGNFLILQDKAKAFFTNEFLYTFEKVHVDAIRDDEAATFFWIVQLRKDKVRVTLLDQVS
jgi:hypothetical protein